MHSTNHETTKTQEIIQDWMTDKGGQPPFKSALTIHYSTIITIVTIITKTL